MLTNDIAHTFARTKVSPNQALVGLTGGIGSGKSTVAAIIRDVGHPVLSADDIARDITNTHESVRAQICQAFGNVYKPDGTLDRAAMAALVFGTTEEHNLRRATLNGIIHPAVWHEVAQQARALFVQGHQFVFIESALLFETGAHTLYDAVIVVDAPEELRIQRLVQRRQLSEEEARKRIYAQIPADEKRKQADCVIHNDSSLEHLRFATQTCLQRLYQLHSTHMRQ
ncbi:MAG: dephospho-CoA kinase [Bacteroidota bacterium]|nr:dephospho-CoA kinase [Candidatus Kapabacteria bacterium]MDW8219757.1 dephospho-CoA kinase [Bacteroidota bacterium]